MAACHKPEPHWTFKAYRGQVQASAERKLSPCRASSFRSAPAIACPEQVRYPGSPDSTVETRYFRNAPEGLLALGAERRVTTAGVEITSWTYLEPPYVLLPREATLGRQWLARTIEQNLRVERESGRASRVSSRSERSFRILGRETVTEAGKPWECVVIEEKARFHAGGGDAPLSLASETTIRRWYSAQLGWFVREDVSGSHALSPGKVKTRLLPETVRQEDRFSVLLVDFEGSGPLAGLWP